MSEFVEVKTSELVGTALNWAVALADRGADRMPSAAQFKVWGDYRPSINWSEGGPLIDRYQVALVPEANDGDIGTESSSRWIAEIYYDGGEHYATDACDSALIALCRAIVAAKLGDVVQVPVVLLEVAR